ncbi:tyrosine-type recombinase/integrase [Amycolatopsis keratiniphila]|uniref:tyrosine-type recombinase/integrase n=1 Tax=Amycolatopsis keratiniphila TaxID=129921 RepID=UPI00087C3128|nr:site-specific integrase [Amycolatopsis keratiniphila]OLZ59501.1 recombinase XerD [Amycolatopsis keratiniphila subsp. nogabecina]SDU53451.1 Site-specific recombinase XerD [Amycolatopsis keratiniphila]
MHEFSANTYKRCTCKHHETGQQLGANCQKLKRRNGSWSSDHGTWYFQAELPRRSDGTRRTRRRGGYPTQTDAQNVLDKMAALVEAAQPHGDTAVVAIGDLIDTCLKNGEPFPTAESVTQKLAAGDTAIRVPSVEEWLHTWLASRKKLRGSTRLSYSQHMRLWLIPHLGHYRIDALTVEHVAAMFDAMAERNDVITAAKASDDPDIRASVHGLRIIGAATMQRYRATLRAALNAAIRDPRIPLQFNPASHIELPSGRRPKALLWTPERVERWQRTGERPSRVMVWTPEQTGTFLDHAEGHPHYVLLHLIAYRGLRRGEACGLPWWDIDLANQSATITSALVQIGWEIEFGEPKSEASGRVIALDNATVDVLRAQKRHQASLRDAAGSRWVEHGLVCTEPDGSPLHPAKLTDSFQTIAEEAGLPPVRLHDLRHGAATLMLAAGADLKEVQELLGHSSIAITADTYTHVLPDLARESAEAAASLVPRQTRRKLPPAAA